MVTAVTVLWAAWPRWKGAVGDAARRRQAAPSTREGVWVCPAVLLRCSMLHLPVVSLSAEHLVKCPQRSVLPQCRPRPVSLRCHAHPTQARLRIAVGPFRLTRPASARLRRRNLVTVMLRHHVAAPAVRQGYHDAITRPPGSERHQRIAQGRAQHSGIVRNGQPASSSRGDSGFASVAVRQKNAVPYRQNWTATASSTLSQFR